MFSGGVRRGLDSPINHFYYNMHNRFASHPHIYRWPLIFFPNIMHSTRKKKKKSLLVINCECREATLQVLQLNTEK